METQEAVRTSYELPVFIDLPRAPGDELRRRLLEVLLTPADESRRTATRKMTYEEFLAWADEDTLAEWVDGEVIMSSPASRQHQQIVSFLDKVVGTFAEQRDLGIVLSAPFQMKLAQSGREPDLLFVAQEHLERLKETYLDGPADLVVEIVSPESGARDRGKKFYEYESGGVQEYWLIDPQAHRAEFYRLERGAYRLAFSGEEGVYRSAVLSGFWLRVEWLWQETLPDVARTTWKIIGLEGLRQLLADLEQQEADGDKG